MDILLEEFYSTDIYLERFHDRKLFLDDLSYQINGITQVGKTKLVKSYLLSLKKSSYLYIDCSDIRIDIELFNKKLFTFCNKNNITTLVLDNYYEALNLINISQIIIISTKYIKLDFLKTITLYPLDYEEFLAFEHKYDSSALNHFFRMGCLPSLHKVNQDERNIYIQKVLRCSLNEVEFEILILCSKMLSQKISAYNIYERLKTYRKISKDKLYKSFDNLIEMNYIHQLEKFNKPKATKKIYLCDISLKSALSVDKNFGRLFENMIFLELLKSNTEVFYDDGIDFYIPSKEEILICFVFGDERALFKKIENLESFIFSYQIKKVTAVTMNKEGSISHPLSKVEMLPFDIWAIGD